MIKLENRSRNQGSEALTRLFNGEDLTEAARQRKVTNDENMIVDCGIESNDRSNKSSNFATIISVRG